ncbi:hypothetical protein [Streptomyces sp. NPDC048636]|uniref:hypothetical protein n=1 Tax=Streptomyces sp. NPDC048636 TaxID=3155762 RepID=UPI00342BA2D9
MTDPTADHPLTMEDPVAMEDPIAPHTPGRDTQRLRRINRRNGERHETRRLRTVDKQEPAPRAEGATPSTQRTPGGPSFPVLPNGEHDALDERLRHAVSGFVDSPRGAVEEADVLLEELAARIHTLLAERRETLRSAWHDDGTVISETEELRLAMRGYRNVLERLLTI